MVILFLTALVWLGISMAEPVEYSVAAKVEMTGYDTVRYAVLKADTAVTLRVETDGYRALLYSLRHVRPVLQLPVVADEEQQAVAIAEVYDLLRSQLAGVRNVSGGPDSMRVTLVERSHRTYRPTLEAVNFAFAEQYGLYGQPTVTPAEVTLYGPEEILSTIDKLPVAAATVEGIEASGRYTLPLEPVWKRYSDVHPSCEEVTVYVPVEAFVEREYRVPIQVTEADTTVELRLYPSEVTLHVWQAKRDLQRTPEFEVAIEYSDVEARMEALEPKVVSFPSYVRLRSVEPRKVQYVIIK